MGILEEEFINPFGVGYNGLHKLSSGKEMADDLALSIIEVYKTEKKMKEEFIISRITSNQGKFHDPLKRFHVKTFETFTKFVVKYKHVKATVELNRNILGSLLAFSKSKLSLPSQLLWYIHFTDSIEPCNR